MRASVEERFAVERMVDEYLAVYHRVVALDRARRADGWPLIRRERFRVGVNYWPARTAMAWWSSFDEDEVAADFARIAAAGLDSVRLFLTWEAFQPAPGTVDAAMLDRLVDRRRPRGPGGPGGRCRPSSRVT